MHTAGRPAPHGNVKPNQSCPGIQFAISALIAPPQFQLELGLEDGSLPCSTSEGASTSTTTLPQVIPTQARTRSTDPTIPPPSLPVLCSLHPSPDSWLDGKHCKDLQESPVVATSPLRPIRKRPRISDLRQRQPACVLQSKDGTLLLSQAERGRTRQRRWASSDTANRAKSWFNSPDRYLASRALDLDRGTAYRLGRPVATMTPRERRDRRRDYNAEPFRSTSGSRSRSTFRRTETTTSPRRILSQSTPSFVHGNTPSPVHVDAAVAPETPRQISIGAIWNVGGTLAARITPLTGVSDGHGGLLSSGSNAPMFTSHFIDRNTSDYYRQRHENRVALALDIDPTGRILAHIQDTTMPDRPSPGQSRIFWPDSPWNAADVHRGKRGFSLSWSTSFEQERHGLLCEPQLSFIMFEEELPQSKLMA